MPDHRVSVTRRRFLAGLAALGGLTACRAARRVLPGTPPSPMPLPTATAMRATATTPAPTATALATPSPTTTPTRTATPAADALFVVDAHEDIAWNWLAFGRDPADDALAARAAEANTGVSAALGERTTGLPQWLQGRVGLIFATIFVLPRQDAAWYGGRQAQTYATPTEAYEAASAQLAAYHALAAREPRITLVPSRAALEAVVLPWARGENHKAQVGLVPLLEGADAIRTPAEVADWHARGLRIVGPAWHATRYAGGAGAPGPLTPAGRELLVAMAAVGMILDLSHMAETAYLEAVDTYEGAVIASHSNPHPFLPTDRGLSDEMIRRLVARDGVVGIVPYNRYLVPGWEHGQSRNAIPVDKVAAAIDYVVQLAGSARHVGLGSDFDGGFGREAIPAGMDSVADLLQVATALAARGYSEKDIAAVMNGNWLRILRDNLPATTP